MWAMTAASRHSKKHAGRIANGGPGQPESVLRTFSQPGDTPSTSPGAGCRLLPGASASFLTVRLEVWT
jgi:hypothetical protein